MAVAVGWVGDCVGSAVDALITLVGGSRKNDEIVGVGIFGGTTVGCGLSGVHPDKSRPKRIERTHAFGERSVRFAVSVMPPLVHHLIE